MHQACHVAAWQSPYLQPHLLAYHLEMPWCLSILTLHLWSPGCQFILFENIHMGIRDRTFSCGSTLQETEKYGFLPGTGGTLLDMREEGNPVIGSPLSLSAYGKSLNPATHLLQNTHLPAQPSHWGVPTSLSATCSPAITSYRQYTGWNMVSECLSFHWQYQNSFHQLHYSTEKFSDFLLNPRAHLEELVLI